MCIILYVCHHVHHTVCVSYLMMTLQDLVHQPFLKRDAHQEPPRTHKVRLRLCHVLHGLLLLVPLLKGSSTPERRIHVTDEARNDPRCHKEFAAPVPIALKEPPMPKSENGQLNSY